MREPGSVPVAQPVKFKATAGTLDDLIDRYYSPISRLGPSAVTQQKVMAMIEEFRKGHGERTVATIRFEHLDAIIARKGHKTVRPITIGTRASGGIHAARKLRKELIRLFDLAVKLELITKNPAVGTMEVKPTVEQRTGGFHAWDEDEIAQYRARHAIGTRERLSMELLLWTDQRRSDVVKMGKVQIKDGRVPVTQEKTDKMLWLPGDEVGEWPDSRRHPRWLHRNGQSAGSS